MQSSYITILMFILLYEMFSTASVTNIHSYCKSYIHLIKNKMYTCYISTNSTSKATTRGHYSFV